jgi:hypothetical protein
MHVERASASYIAYSVIGRLEYFVELFSWEHAGWEITFAITSQPQ